MGNNPTKASRSGDGAHHHHSSSASSHPTGRLHSHAVVAAGRDQHQNPYQQHLQHLQHQHQRSSTTSGNGANQSHSHTASGSAPHPPEARRLTRREREARRLEKELENRKAERELSIKTDRVDGGYLVTLGIYSLSEDFDKPVVRRLIIERKLAPFWRGLEDFENVWTEYQLIAAASGLPVPPADAVLSDEPLAPPAGATTNPSSSSDSRSRSQSTVVPDTPTMQSSIRNRALTLGALVDPVTPPREIRLPDDRSHNGQRIEVFLYKNAEECPICFLFYPPYLNQTRCCDQPICTECFVQIKRADPHPPEHNDPTAAASSNTASTATDEPQLVTEPTCCPFCQTSMFGVHYTSPPFRRGLVYSGSTPLVSPASGSSSSTEPAAATAAAAAPARRRAGSLSADNPAVITSDHIRPDWERKLNDARAKAAHRSATATAIHTAAMLMNNPAVGPSFSFGRSRNADEAEQPRARNMDDILLQLAIRMSLSEQDQSSAQQAGESTPAPARSADSTARDGSGARSPAGLS